MADLPPNTLPFRPSLSWREGLVLPQPGCQSRGNPAPTCTLSRSLLGTGATWILYQKIASYHRKDRKKRKKKVGEIEETCLTGASEEGRVILISREKSHWFLDRGGGGTYGVIAYIRPPYDSTGFSLHVLYCRYGYHLYVTL